MRPPTQRLRRRVTDGRLHLVSSSGGHLELLWLLQSAFDRSERVWITARSPRAERLSDQGEAVRWLRPWDRKRLRVRDLAHGFVMGLRARPRTIVTTGAGIAVPYCLGARLCGTRVIFVETMARVESPSASGRVLSRIADRVLVQWPGMTRVYPGAIYCRPTLLEEIRSDPECVGTGTVVSVGTHNAPFDRLLKTADRAVEEGVLPEPVLAQVGVSRYQPRSFASSPFVEADVLEQAIAARRYVVCHAGSGLMASALRAGRRPLVLARRAEAGEHVDDHQVAVTRHLAAMDLVVEIADCITPADLARAERPLEVPAALRLAPTVVEQLTAALRAREDR